LPRDYHFQPLDYTDKVIELLVAYFTKTLKEEK